MKRIFLFSMILFAASACSNNPKAEELEEKKRDSTDQVQKTADEKLVEEIERRDDSIRAAQENAAKDSAH